MCISAAIVAAVVFQINTGKGYSWVGLGIDKYIAVLLFWFFCSLARSTLKQGIVG